MSTPRMSVLMIEDDARLAGLVSEYLGRNDVDVTIAAEGERGLEILRRGPPAEAGRARFDALLLDLMLPGIDGLEVCRRVRAAPETAGVPVIMLTARGDEVDRIVGLEIGADDYLPKPFNPRELLARLRAVLRRSGSAPSSAAHQRFRAGPIEIDFDSREVHVDGQRQVLTHYEFELLALLARSAGRVLSRDQLLDALKGEEYETFDRSIDVHVSRLRSKLEPDPRHPRHIKTVRGVGYVLTRD